MSDVISMTELELAMRKLAKQVKLDTIAACASVAEQVCREHADPKAGYAAATAIRALADSSQLRPQGE